MSTIEELSILREREDHVEFKEAKHNYPFAGGKKTEPSERRRCASCLRNTFVDQRC